MANGMPRNTRALGRTSPCTGPIGVTTYDSDAVSRSPPAAVLLRRPDPPFAAAATAATAASTAPAVPVRIVRVGGLVEWVGVEKSGRSGERGEWRRERRGGSSTGGASEK